MKKVLSITFLLFMLVGCGQDYNSNYGDYSQYGPIEGIDSSTPDGARLLAAYKVMQTNCFGCHSDYSARKTSAAWVSSGFVKAADATNSTLFKSLQNNGGTMPKNQPQLSNDDSSAIEDWINGI